MYRRTINRLRALSIAMLFGIGASASAQQLPGAERFTVLSNGERVGYIVATTAGPRVDIEYVVDDNGRGPRLNHAIELDNDGLPVSWRIEGRSLFGGTVSEEFAQAQGRARWRSQADAGETSIDTRELYVANDDTPWSLGLYGRALLRAPDRSLNVLPGGQLHLDTVRQLTFSGIPATIYRLTGLNLAPSYVVLDARGALIAELGDGTLTVREGLESEGDRLRALFVELEHARYVQLQQRLAHRFYAPLRIRNVRIFDPEAGRIGELSDVIVYGDRVAAVVGAGGESAIYEYMIDGEGGVLVPGLHDMHAHLTLQSALLYIASGVTGVRDQGNRNDTLLALKADIESGAIAGPNVVHNGLVEGRSPFSARAGIVADSLDEALEAVRWYASHGYWQIKLYNSIHPDWVRPIIEEARSQGMTVTGHVPAFVTPDQAIGWGYRDIAHVNQLMLGWLAPGEDTRTPIRLTAMARAAEFDLNSRAVRRTIALMREHGTSLDTTAVALELLMLSRAGAVPPTHAYNFDHMPIGYQRYRMRTFVPLPNADEDGRYQRAFARLLDTLALLHRSGIQLLPGTDDGTGFTVARELELYVAAGIPASQALALGTLRAERYFGRDQDRGSIERGKYADFFLIRSDPTRNITAIRENRMTVRGGVVYLPSEIYAQMGIRPFVDPVVIRAPAEPERRLRTDEPGEPLFSPDHEH